MTFPESANSATEGMGAARGAVSSAVVEALRGTRGWVKLVGILLFVGAGITLLGAVAMVLGAGMAGAQKGGMPVAMMAGMSILYIGIAAIYIFLGLHLLRYAGAISRLIGDGLVETLENALQSQQKFWRLAGILALVSVGIALVGIAAAIVIPMMIAR